MSVVTELIREEGGGLISFGDYSLKSKGKKDDFEVMGNVYKVKTSKEITKLEKNETLLFETVPGAAVFNFFMDENEIKFELAGYGGTQVIMELESAVDYDIKVADARLGAVKTTKSGKLVFSAELSETKIPVTITKLNG